MIETIYNGEESENKKADINIRLPKNIRQIGQSDKNMTYQIYIEENVLAYIKRQREDEQKMKYGVFVGDKKQGNGYTYIFINGIIEIENIIENTIIFSDDVWTGIYDDMKRYYKNSDILGWYSLTNDGEVNHIHNVKKIHLDHFAGNGRVYFEIDEEEGEDSFYIYERNGFQKQSCYHVYFEKSYEFEDYLFGYGKDIVKNVKKPQKTNENGKYGIALNNLREEKKVEEKEEPDKTSQIFTIKKYTSVASVLLLAGVIAAMGRSGQLDALSNRVQGLVGNILDKDEPDTGSFVSVNGNPVRETTDVEITSAETTGDETIDDEVTSNIDDEVTSNKETSSKVISQKTPAEEQTTKRTEASVSLPNENHEVYIVKAGETLYSILMNKYGNIANMDEVKSLNKLQDEDYVMEGQKILLP